MLHPPLAAVVWQAKLVGQPVWLHGSGSQPCASVPALPAAHWSPVAQVYPALQSTGAHPLASAPVALAEQVVPAGQVNPSVHGNVSQWPAALQRWVEAQDVAVQAGAQVVEILPQHGVTLDRQTLPVAQSLSREQSLCGAGDTQKAPHAEETPDGSDVHT
jgi:hypothetical protein